MSSGSHRRWAGLVLLAIVLWADDASSVPLNKLGLHLFPLKFGRHGGEREWGMMGSSGVGEVCKALMVEVPK
jgi:hypothetical protein